MKTEVTKNLEYYLGLAYGIVLRKDEDGDWIARVEELPGCTAHGSNRSEALENLEEVQRAWIEDALAAGDSVPEPQATEHVPSGKWLQRVPRSLHKKLAELAKKEGVSLNQLATSILAEALGRRYEPSRSLMHSEAADLLWFSTPQGSSKAEWNLVQVKASDLDVVPALAATVSSLPNTMSELDFSRMSKFDFKVTERARKKELAHKA